MGHVARTISLIVQDLLQLLEPLWRVSAGPLDAWSQTFIRKRFY